MTGDQPWIAYQSDKGGGGWGGTWLIHPDGSGDHQIAPEFSGSLILPDWSPDGQRLAMTSREAGPTEPLYEYDLASGTLRLLFACDDPCFGDDEPAYSPDGQTIVFPRYLLPFVDDVPSDCGLCWVTWPRARSDS